MKILIRVDSGNHIGSGHVSRCKTLAGSLVKLGHEVIFATRDHYGHISNVLQDQFEVKLLPGGLNKGEIVQDGDYLSWLGVDLHTEIEATNNLIKDYGGIDLIVIDHYGLDYKYEKEINTKLVFVIDDLMNRKHYADILLDQNLSADKKVYESLSLKDCEFLLGPDYALLASSFSNLRPAKLQNLTKIQSVLAFFGSSDITNESRKVIDAYIQGNYVFQIKVILNEMHQDFSYIKSISEKNINIDLVTYEPNMANAILEADVCFGACGTSSWERCSLGKPSFVVTIADNQKQIADCLIDKNAVVYVGDGKKTSESSWSKMFQENLRTDRLNIVAENSFLLCDGLGAQRVAEVLNG